MTYRPKNNRHYPYDSGLYLGSEMDIVLTTENSEPLDASLFIEPTDVNKTGGSEGNDQGGFYSHNHFKQLNGMVRMYSRMSYCRAYSTDNLWWMMKNILVQLKKRARISFMPSMEVEQGVFQAAGHLSFSVKDPGIYSDSSCSELYRMTTSDTHESHKRLLDNIRVIVGLLSLLLDRRESAEIRRKEYGPYSKREFRYGSHNKVVYQTPTNFWLFSPILAHLMFGGVRWAYFLTQNNFENELWEGFEPGDIKNAISTSDYETGMEIWRLMKERTDEAGYPKDANPFTKKTNAVLEMLFNEGMASIGDGVHKNWKLNRLRANYKGHFNDLPSWENGAIGRVFVAGHPMHEKLKQYMET